MNSQLTNRRRKKPRLSSAAGLSLLELLVVVALIAIVSSFAVVNFARSNRTFKVAGATRTLSNYVEKARMDSVRRHLTSGSITLNSTSSYTVSMDFGGTGTTTSRIVSLPANTSLSYRLPPATTSISPADTPRTIAYDFYGRTTTTVLLTLTDSAGGASSTVVVGPAGDVSTDTTVTGPVSNPTPLTTVTTTTGIKSMQ